MVKEEVKAEIVEKPKQVQAPLVFISHDARDAELAEAFSKLLKSVSAGMLQSFWSSDKKGTEGIEFGDEWYNRLMKKLEAASDVVCLLTERSFQRPWILYEAGVAKGKLDKKVFGIALGIPLSKVSTGPFYQFQNCDDTEDGLKKLIMQLADRVPALEPDPDVVQNQVKQFKERASEILNQLGESPEEEETPSESSTARVLEELKLIVRELPKQVEKRISGPEFRERRQRIRHIHPMFFERFMRPGDPASILVATSLFREEAPWIEALGRELYDAMHTRSRPRKEKALRALRKALDYTMHGPMGRELFGESEEDYIYFRRMTKQLEHLLGRMNESTSEE